MSLEDDGGAAGTVSGTLTSLWMSATGLASSTLRAAPMGASASAMLPDVDHIRLHPRPGSTLWEAGTQGPGGKVVVLLRQMGIRRDLSEDCLGG